MYYYLADGDPEIDSMLRSVCEAGGGVRKVTDLSLRWTGYPETDRRAQVSVETAKSQPRGAVLRRAKKAIYAVQYNRFRTLFEADAEAVAVAWNGLTGTRRVFMAAAEDAGRARLYLERAPLPGRVTVDPVGINQLNALPREPGFYLDWAGNDPSRTGRGWLRLKDQMTARKSRRPDVGQDADAPGRGDGAFIFCPLQVPDDTQIRQFGGWVGSVERFIAVLADAARSLPDGWTLRFKEHPSSKQSLAAELAAAKAQAPDRIIVDNQRDTFGQVAAAHAVVTLNSSVGLQAFYYEKPVIVLGQAFFDWPDIAQPARDPADLARLLGAPLALGFDPAQRNAFMNYLDQVYYPKLEPGPDGRPRVASAALQPKLAAAREHAADRAGRAGVSLAAPLG